MFTSKFLLATIKETPAEAEVISHKLMLRAGMIRKNASGIYTWLPLGWRVLRKIEQIVREEMDKSGALELLMPAIQPAELWQESGRWDDYGPHLLKIYDRHKHEFCFGPTHEEVITDLMRNELRSYKQLPITFYQIQMKFRDEVRPRFGVMRAREFLMKDAYSFHLNAESLQQTYEIMYKTYSQIFTRLGLDFRAVFADTGNIGGNLSHEFHVLANSGEDLIVFSDESDYAANMEMAEALIPKPNNVASEKLMQEIVTPNIRTIEEICTFLRINPQQTIKTLIVKGSKTPLAALVLRGDHELNEVKASKLSQIALPLQFASDSEIAEILECPIGFIGPVGLSIPVIVDRDAAVLHDFICGANIIDKHLINVNWQRDAALGEIADLRKAVEGDLSPDGKGKLHFARGVEVGHIFQLGDKYSKAMKATVLNTDGKATTLLMGCYGIGVSRIVAAAIEQKHDERGIIWTDAIAPFQIALIPINIHKSYRVCEVAKKLYQELQALGFEVLFDDRKERAGIMFVDMDLIGIPHRIVISESGIDKGTVEYKARTLQNHENVAIDHIIKFIHTRLTKK